MTPVPKKTPRRTPLARASIASAKRKEPPAAKSFPIVGIGASAGGLEAFTELLKHLPPDTGMGFVVVQHLDPKHDSALTQLLGRSTSLPVQEVANNLRVKPNHVYVIPPNTTLEIEGRVLKLQLRTEKREPNHSIDHFFKSLAHDQRECAIGVVLSGSASDGTVGLEAIKAEGGITFAQDASARHDSMPRSAIAAGCVDIVLSPENIARELGRIAKHPHVAGNSIAFGTLAEDDRASPTAHEDDSTPLPPGRRGTSRTDAQGARSEAGKGHPDKEEGHSAKDGYKRIMLMLRNHAGVDFSLYKSSTIQRRIARRMVISKHSTLAKYAQFLRSNVKELDALYSDTLISVTSFFRNPETFDALQRKILPKLLQQRSDDPVRVWVLGCSTGQEAYSIAMSFVEVAENLPRARKLQMFATDLNEALLQKARHGLYSKSLVQDVSPERLRRFFVEELEGYRVIRPLREMVVFARQNLVGDPPFSRMDLISCRNLLIYFEPELQKKVFPVFHYALKPGGYLCLGASESIGGFTELFEPVDKKHKIFSRKATSATHLRLPLVHGRDEKPAPGPSARTRTEMRIAEQGASSREAIPAELNAQREADRVAINQYAPPAVLINSALQIVQFRGPTRAYLDPPTGKASFDILKMARAGLMLPLRAAINKAKKENQTARKENIRVDQDGTTRMVNLEVIPLKNLRERSFLVVFEDGEKAPRSAGGGKSPPQATPDRPRAQESRRVSGLETELADMGDYLQSMVEQFEAANEELQASNEEVQSANEELQSLNEELETSKEELESTNEELSTVNEEMASRNLELSRLNNDLTNIQTSAHQAIVLLGRDLTIRRFSVQAEKQFNLRPGDLGRPFGHVRHSINLPELEQLITEVIDTVRGFEREVRDTGGRWHSLRLLPYLTTDNRVDGAVLELVNINDLKNSNDALTTERDYADAIIDSMRDPVLVLHADLRVDRANKAFYDAFQVSVTQSEDRLIYELGNGQWDIPRLRELLEKILPQKNVFNDFEVTHDFQDIGQRTMLMHARKLTGAGERSPRILLGIQDITERKRAEDSAREGEERYRTLFALAPVAVYSCDADGVIDKFNQQATQLWGREPTRGDTDARFCGSLKMFRPDGSFMPPDKCPMAEVLSGTIQEVRDAEVVIERPDGSRITVVVNIRSLRNQRGEVAGAINCFYDITQRKEVELALYETDRLKTEFLAILAHELRNPLAPIRNSLEIMRRVTAVGSSTPPGPQAASATARGSPPVSPPLNAIVATMERQIGHMVMLVDDLLDVGRIGSGKIALRKKRMELASVVYQAVETSRPASEHLGQTITVTLPEEPVYVDADPTRLAQILGNLLNNASKFTPQGGSIWLTVEKPQAYESAAIPASPPALVNIHVRDTGVGIDAEQLSRIFDMFAQVDSSLERPIGGLGIGLTLAKNLVELHGGTIEAHSDGVGHGSEFVVRLPAMQEAPKPLPAPEATAGAATTARRILIVDDNRDAAESLAVLLQMSGHETQIAYDGLEALEAAATFQPEVILLDLGLPKLNGFEAARRIREQQENRHVTLVALTGWGQEEDRQRSKEAGFDAHMVKPVEYEALITLLAQLPSADADSHLRNKEERQDNN